MPKATSQRDSTVRRHDRAVDDDAWIRALLVRAPLGTLATVYDGRPFVNSNLFAYDERGGAIYMHTARAGRTADNVASEERVCFTVTEMGRLLPAPRAFSMSVEYSSVVVFGRARVLTDPAEKCEGLRHLLRKYFSHLEEGFDYAAPSTDELALTSVYRIEIDEWSGKRKVAEADHAGAFLYGERAP